MSSVLKMTAPASDGAFVRELVGQTGTGFQDGWRIHKDWFAKTIDFDEALALAEDAIRSRVDVLEPISAIQPRLNEDGQFVFTVNGKDFLPTDHALEQYAIRAGIPSSSVMRELRKLDGSDAQDHSVMVHLAVNASRRLDQDKKFLLRTYTDGTCRAFLTEKYAPVDNRWYLETLQAILPGARLSHWRGDEDTIYGNLILPDSIIDYGTNDDSDYGGMITVGNSEIGTRTVSQLPSLFRSICMNGCIWGQVKGSRIRRRHAGTIDLAQLAEEIETNIKDQIPLLDGGVRLFLNTRSFGAPRSLMMALIGVVCQQHKITKSVATKVWANWEKYESEDTSLFGVINGITRAGQLCDNETWVKLDEIGGLLVETDDRQWSGLVKRAETFTAKDFLATFGVDPTVATAV